MIAPWLRHSLMGFAQLNNRTATVKLRVPGGPLSLVSVYAPQSAIEFDVRHAFFADLHTAASRCKPHGPVIIFGDMTARFPPHFCEETSAVGPHAFGDPACNPDATSNQQLLAEECIALNMVVANTFIDRPAGEKVRVRGCSPGTEHFVPGRAARVGRARSLSSCRRVVSSCRVVSSARRVARTHTNTHTHRHARQLYPCDRGRPPSHGELGWRSDQTSTLA